MDADARARYDAGRKLERKPFAAACYAPFVSLLLDPRGFVRACCQDWAHSLGNVTQQPLSEIWHGERYRWLRRKLADYDLPSGCANCQWHIDRGDPRGAYAGRYDTFRVRSSEPPWPTSMEFMLSNACNLECVQCVGELSSSIRKHREKLPPLPRVYDERFFEDLRPFLHHLEHATFMGGEPFLGVENWKIWEAMIEENTRFLSIISTNGTIRNERVERILDELPCMVVVSLDGATKATVESIRRNADFDQVMANIRHFHGRARQAGSLGRVAASALAGLANRQRPRDVLQDAARRTVTSLRGRILFALSYCLMPQNQHEFGDFLELAEELGCEAYVNTVYHPPQFSMSALSREELRRVVAEWEARDARMQGSLKLHRPLWDEQLGHLRNQLEAAAAAPRNLFLASVGRRVAVPIVPAAAVAGDPAEAARRELREWAGAAPDELMLDADDIVIGASALFASLEGPLLAGLSLTEVLLRLRERLGGDVEVEESADALGLRRTMQFRDLAGGHSVVRWIALPGPAGGSRILAARSALSEALATSA